MGWKGKALVMFMSSYSFGVWSCSHSNHLLNTHWCQWSRVKSSYTCGHFKGIFCMNKCLTLRSKSSRICPVEQCFPPGKVCRLDCWLWTIVLLSVNKAALYPFPDATWLLENGLFLKSWMLATLLLTDTQQHHGNAANEKRQFANAK